MGEQQVWWIEHFQSEGVTVTVYPDLRRYNGTRYNGNWDLGANIGHVLQERKYWNWTLINVEPQCVCWYWTVICTDVALWSLPRHLELTRTRNVLSGTEARQNLIRGFVMSTCVTFLLFTNCMSCTELSLQARQYEVTSVKSLRLDIHLSHVLCLCMEIRVTALWSHFCLHRSVSARSTTTPQLPRGGVFTFENKWSQSWEIESQSETIIPWHDVSQLIPTMNFNTQLTPSQHLLNLA